MTDADKATTFVVDDSLLARVLAPYKPGCRYVLAAEVEAPGVAL